MSESHPLVTAIVSTYNAERFFRGCMENLLGQTLTAKGLLEVVVIDSGSEQSERAIAAEYSELLPHLTIKKTERESLYAAWNRGARLAHGRYLVNANTDDRHHPDAFRVMAARLEESGKGLCYADTCLTPHANETFFGTRSDMVWALPDYSLRQAVLDCIFGPVTMWRRDVHDAEGGFPEEMRIAGDYAFFLRAAWQHGADHVGYPLGLCYSSVDNLSSDVVGAVAENYAFLPALRRQIPLSDIYPFLRENGDAASRCVALVDYANLLLFAGGGFSDPQHALALYDEASASCGMRFDVALNRAVALYKLGNHPEAEKVLEALPVSSPREDDVRLHNLQKVRAGAPAWELATASFDHPLLTGLPAVVPLSRRKMPWAQYITIRPEASASSACNMNA